MDAKDISREEVLHQLARRIRSIRKAKGYTNYDYFAYEHNISRSQYDRYERGEDIRFYSLVKLVKPPI